MDTEILKGTRRGIDEEDERWFSQTAVEKLMTAQQEIRWLLDRGYKMGTIIDFVGGHYQLSARQRTALQRATSSSEECRRRSQKLLSSEEVAGGCLNIDGFNLIITLEVALSGGTVIVGSDGAVRDLAGLRGTYKLIDKTEKALTLIGIFLKEYQPKELAIYLDAPVSNSGRLKKRILEHSETWRIPTEVQLVQDADPILSVLDRVVTSDSIILDKCKSWFNISRRIIEEHIHDARVIRLDKI